MTAPDRTILILGCGFTGSVLAQRLAFAGRPVVGTTRSVEQASVIKSRGAEPILFDVRDGLQPLRRLRGKVGAVVSCIPPEVERDGSYRDATADLLQHFGPEGLDAFVYVSSTSVYGDQGGAVVTEDTPCTPTSPRGQARLEIEQQVLDAGAGSRVVRPAGIYGWGRSLLHRMAAGRHRMVGGGGAITNRVHVHDLAAILEAAIDRGRAGTVYLASDARPAPQREVAQHICDTYGLPWPQELSEAEARVRMTPSVFEMVTGSKRIDGSRTLEELGVTLRFPDYASGLANVWRSEGPEIQALVGG